VEIIGWLYQFYISEKKDEVFAALKKNVKITKENIPAATQLFTPHWIVRFMVENSLGRLWLLNHPESRLKERMKYYVQSDPEPDFLWVKDPAEIKCLDPCCGSGHILAYFFELLYAMYEEEGYAPQEIPSLIVQNNIFGIDIDERAAELAAFTVAMVAREKDRRFFERGVVPHVIAMKDIQVDLRRLNVRLSPDLQESVELLKEGRNYGSLIPVPAGAAGEIAEVERALAEHRLDSLFDTAERDDLTAAFRILEYLEPRYHVVVTNPPYKKKCDLNNDLVEFLNKQYPNTSPDIYSAFINRCQNFLKSLGIYSMITQDSWLAKNSFLTTRISLYYTTNFFILMRLGPGTFESIPGEVVSSCSFIATYKQQSSSLILLDLTQYKYENKEKAFLKLNNISRLKYPNITELKKGMPILKEEIKLDNTNCKIVDIFTYIGSQPGSSLIYFWYEISLSKIGDFYRPYNKGGIFRKYYGNNYWVLAYGKEGENVLKNGGTLANKSKYFHSHISWTRVSTHLNLRYYTKSYIFDNTAPAIIQPNLPELLAYFNSSVAENSRRKIYSGTKIESGHIQKLNPLIASNIKIKSIAFTSLSISISDWDLRETSWDFRRSPLLTDYTAPRIETVIDENLTDWSWPSTFAPGARIKLRDQAESFKRHWTELFLELHRNEEENNHIFIDLYGLQDELSPEVPYTEITILQDELVESARRENRIEFDESVLARQFVSYGVGCLMGRYSVEQDGLILADAGAALDDFLAKVPNARFLPDPDGILPLTDEDDFPDDLPTAFKAWLRFISGEHYEDNLRWLEDRLGKDLRSYFIRDFYKEHVRRYKNRPIYWMVSSPSGAFRALMYLHRYTKDSVGKILNDYLRPYRTKLEQKLRSLAAVIDDTSSTQSEKTKARKRYDQLQKYLAEIDLWEKEAVYPLAQKLIELDLDDGVKVNYRKLSPILEPVKQLEAKEEE